MPDALVERALAIRRGLAPLSFLVGTWRGTGSVHGSPITSDLVISWLFDETFLEAQEVLRDPSGAVVHEDRALYRFDPEERRVKVVHLLPGGWYLERLVVVGERQAVWEGGPYAARVGLSRIADVLEISVVFPGRPVPDVVVRYVPA